jgi:serine/threonine-protein kinase RsbW
VEVVQLVLSLALPRDRLTVPVARHVASCSMEKLGVERNCLSDIEVALSEACTNVIQHSGPGDEYEVRVSLDEATCVISVVDTGHGFDSTTLADVSDLSAERGRGVELMRALVDNVRFESKPTEGTIVHLEKELVYGDASVVRRLEAPSEG